MTEKCDKHDEFREYLDHFPSDIGPEIEAYATDMVFIKSRYIFTWRDNKHQYGYCTHCKKSFETHRFSHNLVIHCPECRSLCTVKASGRGRKKLVDEAYFVYYEKSRKNPQVIIARGFRAARDYSGDFSGVKTQYLVTAYYIFETGKTVMLSRYGYYTVFGVMKTWSGWHRRSSIFSNYQFLQNNTNTVLTYSKESIKEAVQGTPFRYSAWENYDIEDMVRFFDLYARYPCVEYLTKLGFYNLVQDKLENSRTYSAINWRGKNLLQVLRISKAELKEIKSQKINVDFLFLKLLQIAKKDGSKLSPTEISKIDIPGYHLEDLKGVLKYTSLRKAYEYLKKQLNKNIKHFNSQHQVLTTWRDYLADCVRLEMDLAHERVVFPGDLYRAHQNTIRQVKIKADEKLNKKIQRRLKNLNEQFCFEYSGLLIRPAKSSLELLDEGKSLHHCVGTYAERYAEGKNVLLFIRRVSEPDKPFFTVEIWGNDVIQVRGLKNCNPDKQVEEFMEAFKAEKLKVKKPKSRMKVPA